MGEDWCLRKLVSSNCCFVAEKLLPDAPGEGLAVAELGLTKLLKFGGQSEKDGDDSDDGGGGDGDGGGGGGVLSWRNSLLWNGVHPMNWELYGSYGSYEQDLVRVDWLETVSGAFVQLLHLATWLRLMWMQLKLLHTALGYLIFAGRLVLPCWKK
jgi:hypothetical protein